MDFKKTLLTLLGLAADASDADIETAAKKAAEDEDAEKKAGAAETKPDDKKPADATALAAFGKRIEDQGKELTALTAKLDTQERAALAAGALRAGKIIPLSAKNLSLADFTALVAELPADQVPLEQRTPENLVALSTGIGLGNSADEQVRKQLGLTKETWDKHGKAA